MKRLLIAVLLTAVSQIVLANKTIEVEGHGTTHSEAKLNGFKTAIEFVVGQVLVADTEASNHVLTKDFIGGYSAGYVENYQILQQQYIGGEYLLNMRVTVVTSKIAHRMMQSSNHRVVLAGQKLQDQFDSLVDQRQHGDRILANVLGSYPHNAYDITSNHPRLVVDNRRQPYIEIQYQLRWNQQWLESLVETLTAVSTDQRSCNSIFKNWDQRIALNSGSGLLGQQRDTPCGQEADIRVTYQKPKNWLSTTESFYLSDMNSVDVVRRFMTTTAGTQHVGLVINLVNASGQTIDQRCANIPNDLFVGLHEPTFELRSQSTPRPRINGRAIYAETLMINPKNINLTEVTRVDFAIRNSCG